MTEMSSEPTPRVVLLGASNLTRGLAGAVLAARRRLEVERLEVLAALGHGRSYGQSSRVLWRALPPIVDCGLWRRLAQESGSPTWALVTDIGNDIGYGSSPEEVVSWVELCLQRLTPAVEQVVISGLPLSGLESLGRGRFSVLRTLLFPGSQLTYDQALSRSADLERQLAQLAEHWGAALVQPDPHWYGLDPLHFKVGARPEVWATMLAPWSASRSIEPQSAALGDRFQAWRATAAERQVFGRTKLTHQPCGRLSCGSSLMLY